MYRKIFAFLLLILITITFLNCKKDKSKNEIIYSEIKKTQNNIKLLNLNFNNKVESFNLSDFFSISRIENDLKSNEAEKIYLEYKTYSEDYFREYQKEINKIEIKINQLKVDKILDENKIDLYKYRLENLIQEVNELKKLADESFLIMEKFIGITRKCEFTIVNTNLVFNDDLCNNDYNLLKIKFSNYKMKSNSFNKSIENINYDILK
jgi:hypothetical protein